MASINDLATAATASLAGGQGGGHGASADSSSSSEPRPVRGSLIVLEGLDRSGKTTQVKLLQTRFVEAGKKVKLMRFPDRTTPIGQQINAYLTSQSALPDQAIHLLFSANRWEAQPAIAALLASGTSVLADRYYHSGIVYSAAKGNPELGLRWARAPEAGLPRPDLVVFLDLDEREAARRGGFGDEKYEVPEMQRRVRDLFHGLGAGRVGDVRLAQEAEDLRIVDASPSVEEVAEEIWKAVRPRVEAVERGEVGREVRKVV